MLFSKYRNIDTMSMCDPKLANQGCRKGLQTNLRFF